VSQEPIIFMAQAYDSIATLSCQRGTAVEPTRNQGIETILEQIGGPLKLPFGKNR